MIPVLKYHGLGNDFVMVHYEDVEHLDFSQLAIRLCDRHTFIGGDGLIVVKQDPLEMIYYNSDGSRAEMCGNGIRCFAAFVKDEKIVTKNEFDVLTLAGSYHLKIESEDPFLVEVDMNTYSYNPEDLKLSINSKIINKEVKVDDNVYLISSLLLGVPHTVLEFDDFEERSMIKVGSALENHELFLEGSNINFYQIEDKNHIQMQTYERGAGLTLACGTGACATFAHLANTKQIEEQAIVRLPLGELYLKKAGGHIVMTGPAEFICRVEIEEEEQK
jgi:diaminopimelate epimerase